MPETDELLIADLNVPFDTSFRKAGSMNGHPTYPIPPITTIQGLLYAAMGRPSLLQPNNLPNSTRDREEEFRERVQTTCAFGQRVLQDGTVTSGLWSKQKRERAGETGYLRSPAQRESLIQPAYRIYIGGPAELINTFTAALRDPQRLLYLGHSDALVEIADITRTAATRVSETENLDCVVPGSGENPTLLPVAPDYRRGRSTHPGELKTVSPSGGTVDEYYETKSGEQFVYVVDQRRRE